MITGQQKAVLALGFPEVSRNQVSEPQPNQIRQRSAHIDIYHAPRRSDGSSPFSKYSNTDFEIWHERWARDISWESYPGIATVPTTFSYQSLVRDQDSSAGGLNPAQGTPSSCPMDLPDLCSKSNWYSCKFKIQHTNLPGAVYRSFRSHFRELWSEHMGKWLANQNF